MQGEPIERGRERETERERERVMGENVSVTAWWQPADQTSSVSTLLPSVSSLLYWWNARAWYI